MIAREAREKKNEKTRMIAKMIAPKMIAPGAKKTKTEMIAKMIAACAENRQYLLEFELRGC